MPRNGDTVLVPMRVYQREWIRPFHGDTVLLWEGYTDALESDQSPFQRILGIDLSKTFPVESANSRGD